jgi:pre-mRNA-splicing factor ATP-dependent RNA helicase DHX16
MAAGLNRHKKKRRDAPGEGGDDDEMYDFVFEEQQIDFVCMDTKQGYDHRNKNKKRHPSKKYEEEDEQQSVTEEEQRLEMRPATKHEKLLEGRKKLPVYPYREDFLAALHDHQVLIFV